MIKVKTLCGECIALMKNGYKVTEESGRRKIICENCRRRRYGTQCKIEKISVSANSKIKH